MALKRQAGEEATGRERKKAKMALARTIAVQLPGPTNAMAGPSRAVTFESKKLTSTPRAI